MSSRNKPSSIPRQSFASKSPEKDTWEAKFDEQLKNTGSNCMSCGGDTCNCNHVCDSEPDCDCQLGVDNVCNFEPVVEDCTLDELIENNPPGGVGNTPNDNEGQANIQETQSKTQTLGETTNVEIPDLRTDTYECMNTDSHKKSANKSCYNGCRKKMFELSGNICVKETQSGGLCEGNEEFCDGARGTVTNSLQKVIDQDVVGNLPCPEGCICNCPEPPIALPAGPSEPI